jgi:hypothetical protein
VYRGEQIAGTDPNTILETPLYTLRNPEAQSTGSPEYGGNIYRVGDVGSCTAKGGTNALPERCTTIAGPDDRPEFVVAARNTDYPLKNPALPELEDVGASFLYDGASGALLNTYINPEPQSKSQFSGGYNGGLAPGDLGNTTLPDTAQAAPLFNADSTDDGKVWVFRGDALGAGGGGEQSWQFASLTDPTPNIGESFGGGFTGVGDLVDGPGAGANEVLVGGYRFDPYTEATQDVVADVNFMNATHDRNLMTIPHPEGTPGDGFGVGITPMGDLNNDGFLDFSVSAYLANGVQGGQGRAWIFKSDNSPPPPPPTQAAAVATGPAAPAAATAEEAPALKAGSCTNRTVGTDSAETLRGTLAGDEIFGFGGNDRMMGYQGADCLDGGRGDDRLSGGDDDDKQIGGTGKDRLTGNDGGDNLYGGTSNDRLDGGTGNDMLAGGAANDDLIGGLGEDRMFGEAGGDRLVVGGGRNQVDGGAGNDSIEARNGERDRIICGVGRDRVRADRYDRLNGCEVVSYGGKITKRGVLPPRAVAAARAASTGRGSIR